MKKITSKNFNQIMQQMTLTGEIPVFLKSLCGGVVICNTKMKSKTRLLGVAEWKPMPTGVAIACDLDVLPNTDIKKLHMYTIDKKYHLVFKVSPQYSGFPRPMSIRTNYIKPNNESNLRIDCAFKVG